MSIKKKGKAVEQYDPYAPPFKKHPRLRPVREQGNCCIYFLTGLGLTVLSLSLWIINQST